MVGETSRLPGNDPARVDERTRLGILETQRDSIPREAATGGAPGEAAEPLRFGRFVALHFIGEGAMSRVYAAMDEELNRKVAVKLFRASSDPDDRLRGQREGQALARISHPNVVQIYETGILDARTFIVMEFIDGVTLTTWQTARKRSLQEVLAMYVAVGRGLVAAHSAGVVHRDFKPKSGPAV